MSERYYTPRPLTGEQAELHDAEAHHLANVMRAKIGEEVMLFDGQGVECRAKIAEIKKHVVRLEVIERVAADRELPGRLALGVALPKGDRQKYLIEKCVELGVHAITPLLTERGVAEPVDKAVERLQRGVIEASKQSRRNQLLQIEKPQRVGELVTQVTSGLRLIAHPDERARPLRSYANFEPCDACILIGPEGGFTDQEVAIALAAGFLPVTLGRRILRVETAAAHVASVFAAAWD